VYLDDIIIFSPTVEEHFKHLHLVFEALRAIGMRINGLKSKFFRTSLTWLGFKVTANTLEPDDRLIKTIKEQATPNNQEGGTVLPGHGRLLQALCVQLQRHCSPNHRPHRPQCQVCVGTRAAGGL